MEPKELKIEKGIPLLPYKKMDIYSQTIEKMEEGDSVLFTDSTPQFEYVARQFSAKMRNMGFGTSCRLQPDGSFRVWKLKKPQLS